MSTSEPVILTDLHPRQIDVIFSPQDKARLEQLGRVVWHDGSPTPDPIVEQALPNAIAVVGQTPLPRERLDRSPNLRAVINVEGNFYPNIDYSECQRRNIPVLVVAPFFAQPVAEMALGLALAAARRITEADASIRRGDESLYGDKLLSAKSREAMFGIQFRTPRGGIGYGWFVWKSPDGAGSHFQHGGGGAGFTSVLIRRPRDYTYIAVLANLGAQGEFKIGDGCRQRLDDWLARRSR